MKRVVLIAIALMLTLSTGAEARKRSGSTSLAGVVQPLADKARQIVATCGSKVVSTTRRWGKTPNHREGRAVDVQGNPSCIYRMLADWPGGVSTDYNAVQHVHFSYSPRHEWGLRFRHDVYRTAKRRDIETRSPPAASASVRDSQVSP